MVVIIIAQKGKENIILKFSITGLIFISPGPVGPRNNRFQTWVIHSFQNSFNKHLFTCTKGQIPVEPTDTSELWHLPINA